MAVGHGPTLTCNHEAPIVAGALCRDTFSGGAGGRPEGAAAGHFLPVAHTLKGEGFDASEDGTGGGVPLVPVAFDCKGSEAQSDVSGATPTLRAMGHAGSHANAGGQLAVAFQDRFRGDDGRGYDRPPPVTEGVTGTLETVKPWNVALGFDSQAGGETGLAVGDVAGALHGGGKHGGRAAVVAGWAVRRLTPMECERLQGFPDGWTRVPGASKGGWRDVSDGEDLDEMRELGLELRQKGNAWRVKDPDGPRYKALGNSMAVNAMEYIGRRIELVREVLSESGR